MDSTLRHLLIQRAARLQDLPALSSPEWGTLNYFQFRNRVEGVALGLMAPPVPESGVFAHTGTSWDWICEVAAACCGLPWDITGLPVDSAILGGSRFNDEHGRQPYHDREEGVREATIFCGGLAHGEWMHRLHRLNGSLGWDHMTEIDLPIEEIGTDAVRAALWSALFAGAHARLVVPPQKQAGPQRIFGKAAAGAVWDPRPFRSLFLS